MQPDVIGDRYQVRSAIGRGGMGTVWLARDEKLARDVAVKQVGLLPGESATDSARALREARNSAALSHRNVVTVFDVVEDQNAIWLVMEHVPSRSLSEIIAEEGRLAPERAAAIGAQIADGLAAAHAAGTVHRDVKPGNILVREDGVAKISDFGIARTAGDPTLTGSGLFTGTPLYFSPELARGADPSPAADVWALGASLYAAVEGHPPYRPQANPMAVLTEIAQQRPATPRHAEFLEPVLMRMLDRDPASRWSMADAAHSLRRLADRSADRTAAATGGVPSRPSGGAAAAGAAAAGVPTLADAAQPADTPTAPPTPGAGPQNTPPGPGPSGPPTPERPASPATAPARRRRPSPAFLLVAAALLVVGGLVLLATLRGSPGGQEPAPDARSSADTGPSAGPETAKSPPAGAGEPSGRAAQIQMVEEYYRTAPTDTDAGWAMIGPSLRAEAGRESYDDFWGSIDSVEASGFSPGPGANSLTLTLRYHYADGEISQERQRLDLVRSADGDWLIDNDEVLRSRTIQE